MIFYIDDAKNSKTTKVAMMRFFNVETKAKISNSNKYIDLIDAKLFAIDKIIEFCTKKAYSIIITLNF